MLFPFYNNNVYLKLVLPMLNEYIDIGIGTVLNEFYNKLF